MWARLVAAGGLAVLACAAGCVARPLALPEPDLAVSLDMTAPDLATVDAAHPDLLVADLRLHCTVGPKRSYVDGELAVPAPDPVDGGVGVAIAEPLDGGIAWALFPPAASGFPAPLPAARLTRAPGVVLSGLDARGVTVLRSTIPGQLTGAGVVLEAYDWNGATRFAPTTLYDCCDDSDFPELTVGNRIFVNIAYTGLNADRLLFSLDLDGNVRAQRVYGVGDVFPAPVFLGPDVFALIVHSGLGVAPSVDVAALDPTTLDTTVLGSYAPEPLFLPSRTILTRDPDGALWVVLSEISSGAGPDLTHIRVAPVPGMPTLVDEAEYAVIEPRIAIGERARLLAYRRPTADGTSVKMTVSVFDRAGELAERLVIDDDAGLAPGLRWGGPAAGGDFLLGETGRPSPPPLQTRRIHCE